MLNNPRDAESILRWSPVGETRLER